MKRYIDSSRHRKGMTGAGCWTILGLCVTFLLGVVIGQSRFWTPAAEPITLIEYPMPTSLPQQTATATSFVTLTPTSQLVTNRYSALISELSNGNIENAITLLKNMPNSGADDLKPLSMGVRIMLDHLYVVDATDFQMPSVKVRMDAALVLADRAIQANPKAPDGWAAKALALNWAYRSTEALATLQHALDIAPHNPTVLAVQAEIYINLRRYGEAQALIDEVLSTPQSATPPSKSVIARAYYLRGNVEQILGHVDPSIAAYEAAWAISSAPYNPNDPWMVVPPGYILYQLGPIYLFEGKGDIALQRYTAALQVDKQDPFLFYLRGRVYRYNGNTSAAVDEFQKCLAMDPTQWRCERNLGQMAYEHAHWEETIRDLLPIANDNSQISDDYYYLGAAEIELKDCDRAVTELKQGMILLRTATGRPLWTADKFGDALKRCGVKSGDH